MSAATCAARSSCSATLADQTRSNSPDRPRGPVQQTGPRDPSGQVDDPSADRWSLSVLDMPLRGTANERRPNRLVIGRCFDPRRFESVSADLCLPMRGIDGAGCNPSRVCGGSCSAATTRLCVPWHPGRFTPAWTARVRPPGKKAESWLVHRWNLHPQRLPRTSKRGCITRWRMSRTSRMLNADSSHRCPSR